MPRYSIGLRNDGSQLLFTDCGYVDHYKRIETTGRKFLKVIELLMLISTKSRPYDLFDAAIGNNKYNSIIHGYYRDVYSTYIEPDRASDYAYYIVDQAKKLGFINERKYKMALKLLDFERVDLESVSLACLHSIYTKKERSNYEKSSSTRKTRR